MSELSIYLIGFIAGIIYWAIEEIRDPSDAVKENADLGQLNVPIESLLMKG
jgi:hypothetical protein